MNEEPRKLRCWVGCRALVVGGCFPENYGKVVKVTDIGPIEFGVDWFVVSEGGPLTGIDNRSGVIYTDFRELAVRDRSLQPLQPLDEPQEIERVTELTA